MQFPGISMGHHSLIGSYGFKFLIVLEMSNHSFFGTSAENAMKKLDTMKLLVTIAWEGSLIQNIHFTELSGELQEIGKMLRGWKKGIENKLNETKTG